MTKHLCFGGFYLRLWHNQFQKVNTTHFSLQNLCKNVSKLTSFFSFCDVKIDLNPNLNIIGTFFFLRHNDQSGTISAQKQEVTLFTKAKKQKKRPLNTRRRHLNNPSSVFSTMAKSWLYRESKMCRIFPGKSP